MTNAEMMDLSKQGENKMNKENRALRPDAQAFDEIRIVTIPRYKTSGLSGDEWRISAQIQFYRKNRLIHEVNGYRNIQTACGFLYAEHSRACDDGHAYFAGEDEICDQEGCSETATVTYQLKLNYCQAGHPTDPKKLFPDRIEIRKFCDKHSKRGDCALEDADRNYELINRSK